MTPRYTANQCLLERFSLQQDIIIDNHSDLGQQQLPVMGGHITSEYASETHGSSLEGSDGTNQLANDERRLSALQHENPEHALDVTEEHANYTLNNHQMMLMLLETQNKQRLMMAHQEQDGMAGDVMQQEQGGKQEEMRQTSETSPSPEIAKSTPDGPNSSLWSLALSSLPEKDRQIFKAADSPLPDATIILNDVLLALEKQRDRCK